MYYYRIKKLLKVLPILFFILFSIRAIGQCPPQAFYQLIPVEVTCAGDWQMVFEEHFVGNSLNTDDWWTSLGKNPPPSDRTLFVDFDGPQGDGIYTEGQKYEDYNVSVSGGSAILKTKKENVNYSGIWGENQNNPPQQVGMIGDPFSFDFKYSGGAIMSKTGYKANKGLKIEARIKIPPGEGLFPAFWIYAGSDEIDFFEPKNSNSDLRGEANIQSSYTYNCRKQYDVPDNEFHLWTAIVTPFYVHIFIDDELVANVTKIVGFNGECGDILPVGQHVRNLSFPEMGGGESWRVIFNTAIFRHFAENETVQGLSSTYEVDYVKIYQRDLCKTTVNDYTTLVVDSGDDIVLSGDQYFENITVQDGGSLTLDNAHVYMDHNGLVELKGSATLVLNKSIIVSCVSESRWKGISLSSVGNNVPTLYIKNKSTIENSIFGISNHPTLGAISWDDAGNAIANGSGMNLIIEGQSKIKHNTFPLTIIGTEEALNVSIGVVTFFENEYGVKIIANSNSGISFIGTTFTEFYKDAAIQILQNDAENEIINCTFKDNLEGVSVINSKGTIIKESEFDGHYNQNPTEDRIGIHSFESNIMVYDDNKFKDNYYGVLTEGTYPLSASLQLGNIDFPKNIFELNYFSIESSGNDAPEQVNVINNKIDHSATNSSGFYGLAGTFFLGANLASFKNNTTISPQTGLYAGATGNNFNEYNCNKYENIILQEMSIGGDNSQTVFLENSFESPDVAWGSINLYGATVLDQGDLSRSAANCFEYQTTSDITANSTSQSFDYYYFGNEDLANCEYPESPSGFDALTADESGSYCDNNIGTVNITGGNTDPTFDVLPPVHTNNDHTCIGCVKENIDHWVDYIINTGGDNPLTAVVEPITNPNYDYTSDAMLEDWINYGLYLAMQNEDLAAGVQILAPLNKWKWKIRLFGLYVWFQEYTMAESVLNALPTTTPEEINFNTVQQINMTRLKSQFAYYIPSTTEKDALIAVANAGTPSAGYARSLYHKLTGDILPVHIDLPSQHTTPRSARYQNEYRSYIYPNPADNKLSVVANKDEIISNYIISDVNGSIMMNMDISARQIEIDVSNLPTGLYFVSLRYISGFIETQKVIID